MPDIVDQNGYKEHIDIRKKLQKVQFWASFRGKVKEKELQYPACALSFSAGHLK